jgi:hypothetical protein
MKQPRAGLGVWYAWIDYAVPASATCPWCIIPARTVSRVTAQAGKVPDSQLFPYGSLQEPYLELNAGDDAALKSFWRSENGFPSSASGSFERMLYLSAMTITTVGYGDILPITTTARMLVASEAVLGVTVAGLFLGAWFKSRD